ncbi:MAG: hypothetical protein NTV02_03310 [Candidatus Zambryskibacteria bacterium]|nr:hypothetical protein [Candidatus Zambryskibacteria bacterium]
MKTPLSHFPKGTPWGNQQKGFIALISSIILSLILLGLTLQVSSGNFSARANALSAEFKSISVALARSCSQAALLRLSLEYWYVPNEGGDSVNIEENTCIIKEINHEIENPSTHTKKVTVITQSSYRGAFTLLYTEVLMTNPGFISITSPSVSLLRTYE